MNENYYAYLVRFKRREGQSHWCATLENVHTREILNFATERELLVYLLQTLNQDVSSSKGDVEDET